MNVINELRNKEDVEGLVNHLFSHGAALTLDELRDIKVNIVQRAMNDEFSQKVYASQLPNLVDALIDAKTLKEVRIGC